jgi:hypothetical protein
MQGIDNYIPKTNHIFRVYNLVSVLYLQFVVHVMLFPVINVSYFTLLLSEVSAQSPIC